MNQRPSGYEPDELPDCSIPQQHHCKHLTELVFSLVRKGGLEPPRPKALPPQGSVSTNSTTTAAVSHSIRINLKKEELNRVIQLFSVQLVKFQPIYLVQLSWFEQILNYKHPSFVFWQIRLKTSL